MLLLTFASGRTYSLEELLRIFRKSNPLLRIYRYDYRIKEQELKAAKALPNPAIEAGLGRGLPEDLLFEKSLWHLSLEYPLPNPLLRHWRIEEKKAALAREELWQKIKEGELEKEFKEHCFWLIFYEKAAQLMEERVKLMEETREIIRARVEVGEEKEIACLKASVELQRIRARLFWARKNASAERIKIREMLNFAIEEDFKINVREELPLPPVERRLEALIQSSPYVRVYEEKLKEAKASARAATFSLIPGLSLKAEKGLEMDGKVWRLAFGIEIPLFNWKRSERARGKLEYRKALLNLSHVKKHLRAEAERLLANLRALEEEIRTLRSGALLQAKKNMELTKDLFAQGETSLLSFLYAQNSYYEIMLHYWRSLTEWRIARAELEKILGELR